ncbi:hypothetical protein BX592_11517 [Paraburkholderia rhizosphaerae]|uniref:Uncharacterized protein n=1 Tax=Paraburkholderia rhizosphaerae TaxID=480658 RepID=A0A4R8LMT9_9BURK|nr:hypothetical protein BX592_11517 [Paraburkholderia rhizosphaerae]
MREQQNDQTADFSNKIGACTGCIGLAKRVAYRGEANSGRLNPTYPRRLSNVAIGDSTYA